MLQIDLDKQHRTIKLVQLTDTHLGAKPGAALLGMDTDNSLHHVINLVSKERGNTDLLLVTGDISNSGAVSSYQRFRTMTQSLARHTLWLPGNHDTIASMQQCIDGGQELNHGAYVGKWLILMLDSTAQGEVGGQFSQAELDFLNSALSNSANGDERSEAYHVLICLHHHPISIGCDWLDDQKVANAEQFFSIIDQFDHVRGIVWGHIHQRIDCQRNGVKLMATPSSCVQFAPNSQQFKLDQQNPGYRWLELHADGQISTGVSRVKDINFDFDYNNSSGY